MEHGSHESCEPRTILIDYQLVIEAGEKYCDSSSQLSRVLSKFFAMRSAYLLRMRLGLGREDLFGESADLVESWRDEVEEEEDILPKLVAVGNAVGKFAFAFETNDQAQMKRSLEEMGVLALCPSPERQLSRMERFAGAVSGRARLIFLVELALFAVELGKSDDARRYVSETWEFSPSGWELYNVCIIEGLFAVDAGRPNEAIRWLEESINACQTDAGTSLNCGLRAPNFLLAQRLFELGERGAVLRHLIDCKNIWQRSWMPMSEWIEKIERGLVPEFQQSEPVKAMNLPSCRLALQWMRLRSLASEVVPVSTDSKPKSPSEVLAAREKLMDRGRALLNQRIKESIAYLDDDKDRSDNEPSGPEEQGQPD